MAAPTDANTVTQIMILTIPSTNDLSDTSSPAGRAWSSALDLVEQQPGYQRLYWGRQVESPDRVQLHIVRSTLQQHKSFLSSPAYDTFLRHLQPLSNTTSSSAGLVDDPIIRHVTLTQQTSPCPAVGLGAPFTGTAIYISTSSPQWPAAWHLWTTLIPHVPGCMGVAGGMLEESVDGHGSCYIVFVGWQSIELHEAYHHTKEFAQRRVILGLGNKGYREYGHVKFTGAREKGQRARI